MRLIDADAILKRIPYEEIVSRCVVVNSPTIVEFEGDINKVIVKGEEYHKQLTTTWLGSYSPYQCEHCGFHVDSKTRYCPECGRRATNYD